MASRISRSAVKSGCACEWGAWGQISADGPGHYNPDRSEDPWGRAAEAARAEVHKRTTFPGTVRGCNVISDGHEGRWQTGRGEDPRAGKAAPEIPALKPYWGKPTVRNFRGGDWKPRHHSKPAKRHRPTRRTWTNKTWAERRVGKTGQMSWSVCGKPCALRRQTSKVGTVCASRASTGLCGGQRATAVPTATAAHPRRTAQTRHRHRCNQREQVHGARSETTVAEVENVLGESSEERGLG